MKNSEAKKNTPGAPEATPVPSGPSVLILTRPVLVLLAILLLAPWAVVAVLFKNRAPAGASAPSSSKAPAGFTLHSVSPTNRIYVSKPGPWGNLEYTRIAIEPPEEFLYVDNAGQAQPKWLFKGYTREKTIELFKSAELTEAQFTALTQKARWETLPEGTLVSPDRDTVLALGQRSRQKIYFILALFPENSAQNNAYSMRPELFGERFERSGLSDQTIALVKSLLYPHGELMLFGDLELVLSTMPNHQERMQLVKAISRRVSLLIKLKVDERSNIDELVNYWGFDGRSKDIRPLLESLSRVPGGSSIDISHLMPQFARARLYTYPYPSKDPVISKRDCHWTSFNFFNDLPDDKFVDNAVVRKTVQSEYYPISTGARLGDVVFLIKSNGEIIHSAVYVADDIVFTKNGTAFTQPWTYMTVKGLQSYYSAFYPPEQPLEVMFYRRKSS